MEYEKDRGFAILFLCLIFCIKKGKNSLEYF